MARARRTDNKGRVLQVGESVNTTGRYVFKWTSGDGKRRAIYAVTLNELREKEKRIQQDEQDGINSLQAEKTTLNQMFDLYLATKTNLRDTTRTNYVHVWDFRIRNSALGNMKISDLKQIHIKRLYAEFVKQGLAANTIKIIHNLILPSLELAVTNDLIRKNPAMGAREGTGGAVKKREALTINEEEELLEFVAGEDRFKIYFPMISFALSTGLRIGELSGLRWDDIDTKEDVAHIRRQLIYKNLGEGCKFYTGDLKSEAGRRDIPLTDDAKRALLKQREFDMYLGKGARRQNVAGYDDYVFTNNQGRPFAINAANLILKNIVDAHNSNPEREPLPPISCHILRHTFCSRMAETGMNAKVLQKLMGHSDIGVTMNVYTQLDASKITEEVNRVKDKIIRFKCG